MTNYKIQYFQHIYRENEESFYPNRHEEFTEIIFLQHGRGEAQIDGKTYYIKDSDLIVINKNVEHSFVFWRPEQDGRLIRYNMGICGINKLIGDKESPIVKITETETLNALFQIIEEEYVVQAKCWENICSGVIKALLALINRRKETQAHVQNEKVSQSEVLAKEIVMYLKAHYRENLSLASVADEFFISPYYLAHLIKKHLGISMLQYVTRLQMGEAQSLLHDTDYTVKQIALMLGYQNVNYFHNVFEKNTGMSPGDYRKKSRKWGG